MTRAPLREEQYIPLAELKDLIESRLNRYENVKKQGGVIITKDNIADKESFEEGRPVFDMNSLTDEEQAKLTQIREHLTRLKQESNRRANPEV
jgi:hypothetical protein